jgi:predicted transcriptional regulator
MADWDDRVQAVWDDETLSEREVVRRIDALAAERPEAPEALAEQGGARDSAGLEAQAESFYRRAIDAGLAEPRLGQVVIQLASTIRNLDRDEEAVTMLREFYGPRPEHPLAPSAAAFLALALTTAGRPKEAVVELLRGVAPILPRYNRSVAAYAEELASSR